MKHFIQYVRRAVGLLAALLLLTVLSCFPSCGERAVYTSTYFDTFDTVLTLHVPAQSREEAEKISGELHTLVLGLHRAFDIYHTYPGMNNIKTVNDAAGNGQPVAVSQDVIDLLTLGQEAYTLTGGKVNICLGAVLSLWHDYRTEGVAVPADEALTAAAAHCDPSVLVIDREGGTVMLTDAEASLDVGAIAKGYVAAAVQSFAHENQIDSLLFDLGGHVLALGVRPNGAPWQIGIRDPKEGGVYTTLSVTDASVVTSGDDQRFYTVDGVTYHHLIDPDTLYPAEHHASVTVIVPLSHTKEADVLSTALFLLSEVEGKALLKAHAPDAQGVWIPKNE